MNVHYRSLWTQWHTQTGISADTKQHICQMGCAHRTSNHTHRLASSHTRQGSCESTKMTKTQFKIRQM